MKKLLLTFSLLLFLCSCNKRFDAERWKSHHDEQYFMLKDIVKNKRLLGKTKNEIIELLDTANCKQVKYSDNSWMFVILIPHARATQSPVKIMDIDFVNEKVKEVTVRK